MAQVAAAINHRIRLICRRIVDAHRHSVRQHETGNAARANAIRQSGLNGELHLGMDRAFRRHGVDDAAEQFVTPRLPVGPSQELIDGHALSQYGGHAGDHTRSILLPKGRPVHSVDAGQVAQRGARTC
jgi:hypothetical protein